MKKGTLLIVVLVLIGLAVFVKLDFVRAEGGGGVMIWKEDKAYLFTSDCPFGFRLNVLHYLLIPAQEYFRSVVLPRDRKCILTVFLIAPNGVERYTQKPSVDISDITTLGDDLYARCPGGICKWNEGQFKLISEEDETRLFGINDSGLSRGEFTDVNGWSKRGFRATAVYQETEHYELPIELTQQESILVKGSNPFSVDILRLGHPPERIWYHEQRTRRVSRSEYERIFPDHSSLVE